MGALERPRQSDGALSVDVSPATGGGIGQPDEAAARRSLRAQIARLERELADAFVTAFPMGGLDHPGASPPVAAPPGGGGRLLGRGELAERLHAARATIHRRADEQAAKRIALERMLLAPAQHRCARISCRELGEPG